MATLGHSVAQIAKDLPLINTQLEQARAAEKQLKGLPVSILSDTSSTVMDTVRGMNQVAIAAKEISKQLAGLDHVARATQHMNNLRPSFENLRLRECPADKLAAAIARDSSLRVDPLRRLPIDPVQTAVQKLGANLVKGLQANTEKLGADFVKGLQANTEKSGPSLAELYRETAVNIQKAQDNKLKALIKEMTAPKPGAALRYPALVNFLREDGWCLDEIAALTEGEVLGLLEAALQKQSSGKAAADNPAQPKRMTKAAANKKAMQLANADPSFVHLTEREWADRIGCSEGLVNGLPFRRQVAEKTGRARKGKAPKAVALTDKLLAITADPDTELERLAAEQKADAERSPLESDPPDRPRRNPRVRKKL